MRAHVISAWSAVSPFGAGRTAFVDGLSGPDRPDGTVPDFTAAGALGRKGTRSMDRLTALTVATVGQLLAEPDAAEVSEGMAVVLGTTMGSAQSTTDFTRDSLTGERPYLVDPGRFPNTTMNCAASRAAMWYGLRGANTTIAGGRVAALAALRYAGRLLAAGRATTVLCGGAEELTPTRQLLDSHAYGTARRLGEGCAMVQLGPAGSAGPAEVLAIRLTAYGGGSPHDVMARCLRAALRDADVAPDEVRAVAASGSAPEADVLVDVLKPDEIAVPDRIGDTAAAAAAFQLVAVLSVAGPGLAVVTALDPDAGAGCAVLRIR
ncbi:beta-ketoacyl synthase N-terminal-like domain-containing protein [Kibdelosporangium lantanae]